MRPGHSTAFARSTCFRRDSEIFGESKYFGSGQKRTRVPVCFFGTVPTASSGDERSPCRKAMRNSWPSRRMLTSTFDESAFTTDTPTPCRPPENW